MSGTAAIFGGAEAGSGTMVSLTGWERSRELRPAFGSPGSGPGRLSTSVNSPVTARRAQPISSVDRVYRDLREAIVSCRYLPGSPLRLQELSSEYGMSLIPIREALRRLEVERLVENRPNRGARVATMSLADVDDTYNTRILLESEALRRAWPNIDAATVAHARRDMEDMFAAFDQKRLLDGAELHERHHFDLWARAGSEWLDHLIRILWGHTERYRNLALALQTPSPGEAEYHILVMGAIKRGDLNAAIRHTEEELGRARHVVVEHLSKVMELERTSQSA